MLTEYVVADLVRNPRRTLATMVGVTLGVGLFCGVLFFVDGLSASMTQRAVAPLAIDMQRIVTDRVGDNLQFTQTYESPGALAMGEQQRVTLELRNAGQVAANEVTVRSQLGPDLAFVTGSAVVDGAPIDGFDDNPFDHGPGRTGFNLGTVSVEELRSISYLVEAKVDTELTDAAIMSAYSSRESVNLTPANGPPPVPLEELATLISQIDGVDTASVLSQADLGSGTLVAGGVPATGPAKVFGFDADYARRDGTIEIVEGELTSSGAVLSAEAREGMAVAIGETVTIDLPDGSKIDIAVSGIADLSRARSLFASRRGQDLETFVYTRNSVIVSPSIFEESVIPAFERAATQRGTRLKSPPVREIDIGLDRPLLDADPATALAQTARIGSEVSAIAAHQDYLLDNISNTLTVASADALVAKRLFVFLGVPGGLLAAMLAGYAGTVLASAQRREQATLRIRGAGRQHLLRMLAIRTALLTAAGSVIGLFLGYASAAAILGRESLDRASVSSLLTSALLGTVGGFLATGTALYVTGRRSLDYEINEDRARLSVRTPLWRRAHLDVVGLSVVAIGTAAAILTNAFQGSTGSVYFGRAVELNLALLVLPVSVWITGSLLLARVLGNNLAKRQPRSSERIGPVLPSLYRLSIGRRPWAISNGAIVVSLIVAIATSLAAFTASYDAAKVVDARYANGADLRITPAPTSVRTYSVDDAERFVTAGISAATPVIYGRDNVILRSLRTSDPANLVAIDPVTFAAVAPVTDSDFYSDEGALELQRLENDQTGILVSESMASFLKAKPGDTLHVLLARATDEQVEVELVITALFERLPGFPDGAHAVMSIDEHTANVPTKSPDFFLASAGGQDDADLMRAVESLRRGPGAVGDLQIDTRASTLASDQSSLAALNISGLVELDSTFALSMAAVTIAIFVFGLLLQRRREYVTLRAQGLDRTPIRLLIAAEAGTVAVGGSIAGVAVGAAMGYYFVTVLRPLFVLVPRYTLPLDNVAVPVGLVLGATIISSYAASRLVNRLDPTELLRDD